MDDFNATTAQVAPKAPLSISIVPDVGVQTRLRRQRDHGFSPDRTTIMIVDDEELNIELVRLYLEDGGYCKFCTTTDPRTAMNMMRSEKPDVVLLDLMMPEMSGFEILAALGEADDLWYIPVIILTASTSPEAKLEALKLGATDFLGKPVDASELILRLQNTLTAKALQDHLRSYSVRLEREVRARTAELEAARKEALHCLARAAEFRDDDTGRHVIRVGHYAALIAHRLGFDRRRVELLGQAAQLHDVGKIGISDTILLKPGQLDPAEYELMKQHCDFGSRIIQPMSDEAWSSLRRHAEVGARIMSVSSSPVLRLAAVIAETHHEKWDGSGYPRGLAGDRIPIEGRITSVADVFDALSSKRPYKESFSLQKCFAVMEEGRGKHFDPRVLDAFFSCYKQVLQIKRSLADPE